MKRSEFFDLRLPERGAREGEANDPADIEDLTYDFGIVDAEMERQRLADEKLEKDKATREELAQHTGSTANPHKVTKTQVGLGNVPNVATNDQTPTYEAADEPAALVSGERMGTAFGKISAAVAALIAHLADGVKHITAAERDAWNSAADAKHSHGNKALLDAYEQTEKDLAAAVSDRHSHGNKPVLDGITQELVDGWSKVGEKLPLTGGALTGYLTLHAAPTQEMHAATKKYVDDTLKATGSGDMAKSVYDPQGLGLPLLPENGDGTQVTAVFAPAQQDEDICSGESLGVLFGKIARRLAALAETIAGKAASSHTHDDRYYTETETNNLLAGKAASSHTHTKAQVGLGNVDNTADSAKSVKYAASAGSAADQTARNSASAAQTTAIAAMPKAGGTFTGNVVAYNTNRTGWNLHNSVVCYPNSAEAATNLLVFYRK